MQLLLRARFDFFYDSINMNRDAETIEGNFVAFAQHFYSRVTRLNVRTLK